VFDEPFAHGRGLVHQIDPRVRVLVATAASIAMATLQHLESAAGAAALVLALVPTLRPPLKAFVRRLSAAGGFFLLLWCVLPWATPGPDLFQLGPVAISQTGVRLATTITLKGMGVVLLCTVFLASLGMAPLGHALRALGLPSQVTALMLLSYRHIFTLAAMWRSLWDAARLRGFQPRTDAHSYRTVANLVALVIVRSLDQATRTREAMLLRGFAGVWTSNVPMAMTPKDWAFLGIGILTSVGLLAMDRLPDLSRLATLLP